MKREYNARVEVIKNFVYQIAHDGYGTGSRLYEGALTKGNLDYLVCYAEKRLYGIRVTLLDPEVIKYFKEKKTFDFLIYLVSYFEKTGPVIVCSKDDIDVVYMAKISDSLLDNLIT